MVEFINSVSDAVFDGDTYLASVYDLVYTKAILAYYTNIKVNMGNDRLINLLYNTDIIDKIYDSINQMQRIEINDAIQKAIEFKKQQLLSNQARQFNAILGQLETYTDQLENLYETFKDIDFKKSTEMAIKLASVSEDDRVKSILDFKDITQEIAARTNNV